MPCVLNGFAHFLWKQAHALRDHKAVAVATRSWGYGDGDGDLFLCYLFFPEQSLCCRSSKNSLKRIWNPCKSLQKGWLANTLLLCLWIFVHIWSDFVEDASEWLLPEQLLKLITTQLIGRWLWFISSKAWETLHTLAFKYTKAQLQLHTTHCNALAYLKNIQ